MSGRIRFNAFDMSCVAHQSPGLWRHPDDRSTTYKDLRYWTELARLLERGIFDGVFVADMLGTYDTYGGDEGGALRHAAQLPVNDPTMLVSAMAAVTEHLGFGVTVGTSFEHPYPFARRASTLDHLTGGRLAWNVVTGCLPTASRAMGDKEPRTHDEGYDRADEYLEVLYQLWEGSWEDDAVVRDPERGVYTDPSKVHRIDHRGKWFDVSAIHLCEPSPQRTPVIYQAGSSQRGLRFASEHAEVVFTAAPTKEVLAAGVRDIRSRLSDAGRAPHSAKIYTLLTVIVGETSEAARAKYAELTAFADDESASVFLSAWTGVDLEEQDLDEPISAVESTVMQSAAALFAQADPSDCEWTVRDVVRWIGIGGVGPCLVGSPAEVADELQAWVDETGVDGFNLPYAIMPGTFTDVVDLLVPELQRRGVYPTSYEQGTLRHKLIGRGDRLSADHRGASHRIGGTGSPGVTAAG